MEKTIFSTSQAGYTMEARVEVIGYDLFIAITGGDTPHIGTITTLTKSTDTETIRFPSHSGRYHKDDVLAERIALSIREFLPGNCVITSGVHVDHISKEQIMASTKMAADLGHQIMEWLKQYEFTAAKPVYYEKGQKPE